jgi:hypothetical protein
MVVGKQRERKGREAAEIERSGGDRAPTAEEERGGTNHRRARQRRMETMKTKGVKAHPVSRATNAAGAQKTTE